MDSSVIWCDWNLGRLKEASIDQSLSCHRANITAGHCWSFPLLASSRHHSCPMLIPSFPIILLTSQLASVNPPLSRHLAEMTPQLSYVDPFLSCHLADITTGLCWSFTFLSSCWHHSWPMLIPSFPIILLTSQLAYVDPPLCYHLAGITTGLCWSSTFVKNVLLQKGNTNIQDTVAEEKIAPPSSNLVKYKILAPQISNGYCLTTIYHNKLFNIYLSSLLWIFKIVFERTKVKWSMTQTELLQRYPCE